MQYLVVHGGAGNHSQSTEPELKRALRRACKTAVQDVSGISSAISLVEISISVLEDDPCLNAGFGSNLTLDGTVECDASIIQGRYQSFGGVGAVQGVKHPIALARRVLDHAQEADPVGRIPPLMLVSQGARRFGASRLRSSCLIEPEALIHPKAVQAWTRWKELLGSQSPVPQDAMQDTVGAISYTSQSEDAVAGVSSGGLLLKYPGRIGEAAIYGAGCWADYLQNEVRSFSVACSVSGAGEHIIRTSLAKTIGKAVLSALSTDDDVHDTLQIVMSDFWTETRKQGDINLNAGVILLTACRETTGECTVRLWCAFTTPSMAIAYVSPMSPTVKASILRQTSKSLDGNRAPIFITALSL